MPIVSTSQRFATIRANKVARWRLTSTVGWSICPCLGGAIRPDLCNNTAECRHRGWHGPCLKGGMATSHMLFTLVLGCSGADDTSPTPDDTGEPAGAITLMANLTGAKRLVHFGTEARREAVGAPDTLWRELDDGTLEPVFPENVYLEDFHAAAGTAYARLTLPLFLTATPQADGGADTDVDAEGFWCRHLTFSVDALDENPVYCLDFDLDYPECHDETATQSDNPCLTALAADGAMGMDGTIWLPHANFVGEGDTTVWAYANGNAYQATPLPLPTLQLREFRDVPHNLLLDPGTGIELYYLDGSSVGFKPLPGDTPQPGWQLWGDTLLLESGALADRMLDLEARSIVSVGAGMSFDPPTGADPRFQARVTDGEFLYVGLEGSGVPYVAFYRCDPIGTCVSVDDTDKARLESFFPGPGVSGWDSAEAGGIRYYGDATHLYLLSKGQISDNLSADLIVRDVRILGGELYFSGVNADNIGGQYKAVFDETAGFSFTLLDSFEGTVVELVDLDL
jgi:hypothetical protein